VSELQFLKLATIPFSPAYEKSAFPHILNLYLESVYKLTVPKKAVLPAKAGIQFFQDFLDAGSSPA